MDVHGANLGGWKVLSSVKRSFERRRVRLVFFLFSFCVPSRIASPTFVGRLRILPRLPNNLFEVSAACSKERIFHWFVDSLLLALELGWLKLCCVVHFCLVHCKLSSEESQKLLGAAFFAVVDDDAFGMYVVEGLACDR